MASDRHVYALFEWEDFFHSRLVGLGATLDAVKAIAERMEPRGVRWQKEPGRMAGYVAGLSNPIYAVERREVEDDGNAE